MAGTWRLTAPLPSGRIGLKAASVDNKILVFGENITILIQIIDTKYLHFAGGYDYDHGWEEYVKLMKPFQKNEKKMKDFENIYYLNDILQYNRKNHIWQKVGEMKERRVDHAVAVLADVNILCP